jgi:GxxExxY protein
VDLEVLGNCVIGAAIKVHRELGPGLLESAYQKCLEFELGSQGLHVECEVPLPIKYGSVFLEVGYRIDMLIEDRIIVENKTVDQILPVHEAQLLTYLRMKGCHLGYLLNWHVPVMKQGIRRMVHLL